MTDRVEGRPLEDVDLVRLARDGDVHAYGELVERYREVAFRTAWLITRSTADAEDAAQEAFVKAFYALGRFRAGEAFRPWVLRIVANEAKNRRRSAGRRERLALRVAGERGPGTRPRPPRPRRSRSSGAKTCWPRSNNCPSATDWWSRTGTCSSSQRPRPPRRSGCGPGP